MVVHLSAHDIRVVDLSGRPTGKQVRGSPGVEVTAEGLALQVVWTTHFDGSVVLAIARQVRPSDDISEST